MLMLTFEGCLTARAAVAAPAGNAHNAQVVAATAVTDISRTTAGPTR
jgi:hypothetical protein